MKFFSKIIALHVSLLGSRRSSSIFIDTSLMTSLLSFIELYDIILRLVSLCLRVQCDIVIISSCSTRLVYSWMLMRISANNITYDVVLMMLILSTDFGRLLLQ